MGKYWKTTTPQTSPLPRLGEARNKNLKPLELRTSGAASRQATTDIFGSYDLAGLALPNRIVTAAPLIRSREETDSNNRSMRYDWFYDESLRHTERQKMMAFASITVVALEVQEHEHFRTCRLRKAWFRQGDDRFPVVVGSAVRDLP
jgi:hypothetical protein